MIEYTHQIVRMERGVTKGSGSPMWYCLTKDGERVNVFSHANPERDNTIYFREAGYFEAMDALKEKEVLEWSEYPIDVAMRKTPDGKWWTITAVAPRPEGAEPDARWQPDIRLYRARARQMAKWLVENPICIVDVEMTGLGLDDEITAIAILSTRTGECYESLISPRQPEKLLRPQKGGQTAADVTGLMPEMLDDAPEFEEAYPFIAAILSWATWCAYNAPFDVGALDRECSNQGLSLLTNAGVFDAAQIAAEYLGNWNEKAGRFDMVKLAEAATQLGIQIDVSHAAGADARTTYAMLKAIADDVLGQPF